MHGKNVHNSWNCFFLDAQRFRNALHKCTPKPCTDLKSRNIIAFSNIGCFIDAISKLFSVTLRGYTYKQITVYNSFNYFLLDSKRFRNACHKCAANSCIDLKSRNAIALSLSLKKEKKCV